MRRSKIFLFLTLIFVISCTKDINVDLPSLKQKLVANCWFTGDGNWYVKVTKTKNILDDGPIEIVDDAKVEIHEEDSLIEILPYIGEGYYGLPSGYFAKVGKAYNLAISCSGYPNLTATEFLKEIPIVLDLKIDLENKITIKNLTGHFATIHLNDNPNTIDYYNIIVYRNYITPIPITVDRINYNPGDTIFNDYVHFHVNELIDKQFCHISYWFINDNFLLDSNTPIQLLIDQSSFENTISFSFEINAITESYYNYGSIQSRYFSGGLVELNGVAFSYTEPSQIKSNIVNGYGIFASYNGHKRVIGIH